MQTGASRSALAAPTAEPITMRQSGPEYVWTLQTPGKAGVVQIILTLRDARGEPVRGKEITGAVWMPDMPMRGYPLELEFQEIEAGEYGALVQYKHGGFWRVMARFGGKDGKIFHQAFDFKLKD